MGVVCKNLQTELALQRKESMPNRNKAPLKNTLLIDLPVKVKGRLAKMCSEGEDITHLSLRNKENRRKQLRLYPLCAHSLAELLAPSHGV